MQIYLQLDPCILKKTGSAKRNTFCCLTLITGILLFLFPILSNGQEAFMSSLDFNLQKAEIFDAEQPEKRNDTLLVSNLPKRIPEVKSMISTDPDLELRKKSLNLNVFGYYRLFLYYRNIAPSVSPFERSYGVGDGYREPMLSLNVTARPNGKTSFGTELFLFTPYLGTGPVDNVFEMNLGLNFYGNFRTEVGNFGVRAGGIHWYNLSPFTMGVYQVLDRFSIFDRTPWEGVNNTEKYDSYYQTGSVNVGDLRWNFQPFQGIILDGSRLPGDINFSLMWGKTQPNGGLPNAEEDPMSTVFNMGVGGNVPNYQGFNGTARVLPSYITGGRVVKTFGKQNSQVALNSLINITNLDSLSDRQRNYEVHTVSFDINIDEVNISGELGGGRFVGQNYAPGWAEALMVRVKTSKDLTLIPLDVQLYQIGADYFNQNGEVVTNSNPNIQKEFATDLPAGNISAGGLLTQVNQLAHNRRGLNINTGIEIGNAKFNVGWGIAQELEALSSEITFIHRVNGLAISRLYNPFPANATAATTYGPNNRKFTFFRGAAEVITTTDIDPATAGATTKKFYNTVDLQGKYKTSIFGKPLYLFYLGSFSSAKVDASLIPVLSDDSYIFVQYHELDIYYELFDRFILTGYLGLENARGGRFTEWDPETQLPRDQLTTGIGTGFDWMVADNAGLYFRWRWIDFEDRNSSVDFFSGEEATFELKIYF